MKSLQKEQNNTNLLLWPPICRNKSSITPKWFNSLDTNSTSYTKQFQFQFLLTRFFWKKFLGRRFSFNRIFFQEDFFREYISFKPIFFREDLFSRRFFSRGFSSKKTFFQKYFLRIIFFQEYFLSNGFFQESSGRIVFIEDFVSTVFCFESIFFKKISYNKSKDSTLDMVIFKRH